MQSGNLDHLFHVLQRSSRKNSMGEEDWQWSEIGQFYAAVSPVSAQTFTSSGAMGSAIVAQLNYRPNDFPELNYGHLLRDVDTQEVYAITGILPISKSKARIMCKVGAID